MKKILFALLYTCTQYFAFAQAKKPQILNVPFDKRLTLVFDDSIADNVLGAKTIDATVSSNKYFLKSKSSAGFKETSLYIELNNGMYYDFILRFNNQVSRNVIQISRDSISGEHNIIKSQYVNIKKDAKIEQVANKVVNPDSIKFTSFCTQVMNQKTYLHDKGILKRDMYFSLQGIYVHDDKLYFKVRIENKSNVPFTLHSVVFNIIPTKTLLSKTITDAELLQPIYTHNTNRIVSEKRAIEKVFVFNKFTFSDEKKLMISLFESGGDREIEFPVYDKEILKARTIK